MNDGADTQSERSRVLVVDSDREYAQIIADAFALDYDVSLAHSTEEAIRSQIDRAQDVVIIDCAVTGRTGIVPLMQGLREIQPTTGIVLTSRNPLLVGEIVHWFDAGADDYVPKPFHLRELRARVLRLVPSQVARAAGDRETQVRTGRLEPVEHSGAGEPHGAAVTG